MAKRLLLVFLIGLLLVGLKPVPVFSAVTSCTASVSPTSMRPSTPYNLTFTVNNTSASPIVWAQITRPSTNFSLDSATDSSWDITGFTDSYIFLNGSLAVGASHDFVFTSTAGATEIASQNWVVTTSGSADGSSPVTCTGSLGVSISNSAAASDLSGPVISALTVSGITATEATISFTTDKSSTDQLQYGTSIAYGTTSTNSTAVTSHSFSVSGLSADTLYYYQIQVTDDVGNIALADGNTFTTSKTSSTTTTTTVTTTVVVTATPTPVVSIVPTPTPKSVFVPIQDSSPPTGLITTDLSKPFKVAPQVGGIATDNLAVEGVEYSTDNGLNYLPVDKIDALGKEKTGFSFQPTIKEDGNYLLRVRVKDNSNLFAVSNSVTLVIDRLPPQVGASLIAVGPEELLPTSDGVVLGLVGLTEKFTLAAVGGPLTVDLLTGGKVFSLVKNPDNGLWSGGVRFSKPGVYRLNARSVDGAHNQTTRSLNSLVIVKNGTVKSANKPISGAVVSVYSYDETSGSFVIWDGSPYSQTNPQRTGSDGQYRLFLPPGKYYLAIGAANFKTLKSQIFTISQNQPLNTDFSLEKAAAFTFGPLRLALPDFQIREVKIDLNIPVIPKSAKTTTIWLGRGFPATKLINTDGKPLSTSLLGKPTVVSFLNTWSPLATSELGDLNKLSANPEVNTIVIIPEESVSSVEIFKKRGGYTINMIADPDGELATLLGLNCIPTHLFLNRQGVVSNLKVGLFNETELFANLIN